MELLQRLLAVLLVATAVAVAVNLILTPVYHDGSPDYPVWEVINWFMAASTLVAMVVSVLRWRDLGSGEPATLDSVGVSVLFYASIVLTMLFFWGWIWTLNPDSETGEAVTSHIIYFPLVDSLFVVVTLAVGHHLWSEAGD